MTKNIAALLGVIALATTSTLSAQEFYDIGLNRFTTNGTPDTAFGGDGEVIIQSPNPPSDDLYASDLLIDGSGKIVVGLRGYSTGGFVVGRFSDSGQPDTGFSSDGYATAGSGDVEAIARYQTKTIAVGTPGLKVARFNSDGSLDATFGGTGIVTLNPQFGWTLSGKAVAVQNDGKIIVAGDEWTYVGASVVSRWFVARLTTTGALDTTFSVDGKQTIDFPVSDFNLLEDLALRCTPIGCGNGTFIVIAGRVYNEDVGATEMGLAMLNHQGNLMSSFDTDGLKTISFDGEEQFATAVAIDSSDRIVVGGTVAWDPANSDFALARVLTSGAMDTTFSSDGKLAIVTGLAEVELQNIFVSYDARIIAVGSTPYGPTGQAAITSVLHTGAMNSGFGGGDGVTLFDSAGHDRNTMEGVWIDAAGRFITAGMIYDGPFD